MKIKYISAITNSMICILTLIPILFLLPTTTLAVSSPPCDASTFGSDGHIAASDHCLYVSSSIGPAANRSEAEVACASSPVFPSELATAETTAKWAAMKSLIQANPAWYHVNMRQYSTTDYDDWYWILENGVANATIAASFFSDPDLHLNGQQTTQLFGYLGWYAVTSKIWFDDDEDDFACKPLCQFNITYGVCTEQPPTTCLRDLSAGPSKTSFKTLRGNKVGTGAILANYTNTQKQECATFCRLNCQCEAFSFEGNSGNCLLHWTTDPTCMAIVEKNDTKVYLPA